MFGLLLAIIYLGFISLGLPDSLLGAAWPVMRAEIGAPISYAGIISMIICLGTIVSSLMSDMLTKKFGTGLVTAVSVATTAVALFLFSVSRAFWQLALFAVPYGLGAGGVDASLNNFVALHYKSRHMSWLHCMWGLGATVSPYIMSFALSKGFGWRGGYATVSVIQIVLTALLFTSLPLWKKVSAKPATLAQDSAPDAADAPQTAPIEEKSADKKPLSMKKIFAIKGAATCFLCFFCYCSLEQTTILWASSYMISHNSLTAERAAAYASLFFIGITLGRGINGFLTFRLKDKTVVRIGAALIAVGVVLVCIKGVFPLTVAGFIVTGLGCAPVYPSIIQMTPRLFGAENSQAMIGVQMASAYAGSCLAPPVFGLMAGAITPEILPFFILAFLAIMAVMFEVTLRAAGKSGKSV